MKKLALAIVLILGTTLISLARNIDTRTAELVASNYLMVHQLRQQPNLSLTYSLGKNASQQESLMYIFDIGNDEGFIIVAGEDASEPILGYTLTGSFDQEKMPPGFRKWMEAYKYELAYIADDQLEPTTEIAAEWAALQRGNTTKVQRRGSVNPLLMTQWGQGQNYNGECPNFSMTGCVATAMAQIMKYYDHPTRGTGSRGYYTSRHGYLFADFGMTSYQWGSMPNKATSPNPAISKLMYHCGVAVQMNYGPSASNSRITMAAGGQASTEYALKTYFGYDHGMSGVFKRNFPPTTWVQMLKNELDEGRPILYGGQKSAGGGHAFVVDGYSGELDLFHINWGWDGNYDGHFYLSDLNPTRTAGKAYNILQRALIGIEPASSGIFTPHKLKIHDVLQPTSPIIRYGQAFSVSTNIQNYGANGFQGELCAAVFDMQDNFIDYVEIKSGISLSSGYIFSNRISFSTSGLYSVLPGNYYIAIYQRAPGGNWTRVHDGNFVNFTGLSVRHSNDIELYSLMTVSPSTTAYPGQQVTVNVNVLNNGNQTFYGDYYVNLYQLDGTFVEEIGRLTEVNGLPPNYIYSSPYLNFTKASITASPGTYLLALAYKPNGGSLELAGSTTYQNPIYFHVIAAPIQADQYEFNDMETSAHSLSANFIGNQASINTSGTNHHVGTDQDYFQVFLPAGYSYTINARAHDSYDSGNGQPYTNDVAWSYKVGNQWSQPYDDTKNSPILVSGGQWVKFMAEPYFEGNTGTYLLDIEITRSTSTAVNEEINQQAFVLYPNPAQAQINLKKSVASEVKQISIIDLKGRQVKIFSPERRFEQIAIPIQSLSRGTYVLLVQTEEGIWSRKFIKN